VPYISVYSFRR